MDPSISHPRKKMPQVKDMGIHHQVSEAQRTTQVGRTKFKVYSDKQKATAMRTSTPANELNPTASGDFKGNLLLLEKTQANRDVRRKALADVGNIQSGFSRSTVHSGAKPVFSVRSKIVNPSSRKSSLVQMKGGAKKIVGVCETSRRDVKDSRASSEDQRTDLKNSACKYGAVYGRKGGTGSLVLMRNSSMVLERVNDETNNTKGNYGFSEKAKRISGLPVQAKVSKKVVPQVTVGRSQLRRNRVSDGHIILAPKEQTDIDARVSSRKSVRPVVKDVIKACNVHRTSRSKCTSATDKPVSSDAILSKQKEEAVASSLLENIHLVASNEATQGETSTNGQTKLSINELEVIARRRSDRRRSYTALLMTKSKLLDQLGGVMPQEKLPSIYDECNQLEVAEYVDDIYQYYWVSEAQSPSLANYMSIQTDITPKMRGILVNWLIEVHFKFDLMQETLYLMVTLLDQYLSQVQIKKKDMQLVGLTSLLLASKYEDYWHPRIKDLISISAESYTRSQVLAMEKLLLNRLKFRLNAPTPYVFMLRFLKAAQSNLKLEHLAFYLIELSLVEYEALKFKPSMLCASAIYVARSTLQLGPAWTPLLVKHARYEVPQIRECAEMMLRFQKSAATSQLKVTYEKYTKPDLSSVATITPLDELPF